LTQIENSPLRSYHRLDRTVIESLTPILEFVEKVFIRMPVGRISNPLRINAGKYPLGGLEIRPTEACSPAFSTDSYFNTYPNLQTE